MWLYRNERGYELRDDLRAKGTLGGSDNRRQAQVSLIPSLFGPSFMLVPLFMSSTKFLKGLRLSVFENVTLCFFCHCPFESRDWSRPGNSLPMFDERKPDAGTKLGAGCQNTPRPPLS